MAANAEATARTAARAAAKTVASAAAAMAAAATEAVEVAATTATAASKAAKVVMRSEMRATRSYVALRARATGPHLLNSAASVRSAKIHRKCTPLKPNSSAGGSCDEHAPRADIAESMSQRSDEPGGDAGREDGNDGGDDGGEGGGCV